jgi:hypothetical protein
MAAEFNIKNGCISNNNSIVQGTLTANTINLSDTTLAGSGSLNGSVLNIAQTWNTSGLPTAIKLNVTDITSASSSLLMDLQITGTSKFSVGKDGTVVATNGFRQNVYQAASTNSGVSMRFGGAGFLTTWGLAVENANNGNVYNSTGGTFNYIQLSAVTFNPTIGNAVFNGYQFGSVINQTGTATGITRGLYINPIIVSATDFRAIEVTAGKIVFSSTITPPGTTGAQTINKISGKVNAAAGTTSLVVTNSAVTTSSIVLCQLGTNDDSCVIKSVVEGTNSFTINYSAPTAETVIKFLVIN